MPKYVHCPEGVEHLCKKAEGLIIPLFQKRKWDSERGAVLFNGERYIMYRSEAVAFELREQLSRVMGQAADIVMYHFGKACGKSDAIYYCNELKVDNAKLKLAIGSIACAMNGFAVAEILPESNAVFNEDFLVVYQYENSYEAEANLKNDKSFERSICFMNAGYSAGWCSEVSGMRLESKEITCRAKGDSKCMFVLAPANRINKMVEEVKTAYNLN
ncbi:hypothetical protein CSA37_02420 [Candidatus Fermentibacteria bacterium]|nr:MAG: hypothetical protein CSA37_02420 [Candidatus Fermentibacteria bacterium]